MISVDTNFLLLILIWAATLTFVTLVSVRIIKKHPSYGFAALVAFYVVYLTASQVIAARTADFGSLDIFGRTIFLIAPCATIVYSFISQVLDMINEVYGRKKAFGAILISFMTQVLYVVFIFMTFLMKPSPFFEFEEAWFSLFSLSAGIVVASWISFLICSFVDAYMFSIIKNKFKEKEQNFKGNHFFNPYIWLRSLLTDAISLALDTVIFIGIAFWIFGGMPLDQALVLMVGQMIIKVFFGVLDTPWFVLYKKMLIGHTNTEKQN
ncbi:MAG: queuosine precursor transporter [Methanosarcinaceae archaeon]|nr:queuosine precursor transporter [Methanosarcinaceae archaeon]